MLDCRLQEAEVRGVPALAQMLAVSSRHHAFAVVGVVPEILLPVKPQ